MLDNLTESIVNLRNQGLSYTIIADELNVSYDTVRGRLRRYKGEGNTSMLDVNTASSNWRVTLDVATKMKRVYEDADYWDRGSIDVNIDIDKPLILVSTSDWHIGDKTCNMEALTNDITSWLNTPALRVVIVGDLIENGLGTQGMQTMTEQLLSPDLQHVVTKDILSELYGNGKLLAVTAGNHEWRSDRIMFETFRHMIDGMSIPSFGNKGSLAMQVNNVPYSIFMGHKMPGGTNTNPFGAHIRVAKDILVPDISLIGHVHTWNYGLTSAYGRAMHMCTNGSYVEQEYAARFYNATLAHRNHYFVLGHEDMGIAHFNTLEDALAYRDK